MVALRKETEEIPAKYPFVSARLVNGICDDDKNPGDCQLWQRIEAYTRTRYTEREVIWIIEASEGEEWTPPLSPITSLIAEKWEGRKWVAITLLEGPLGLCISSDGKFRIRAKVGGGDVPPAVAEAYKRLHEYSRGIAEQFKGDAAFMGSDVTRPVNWAARSIQISGAADALRPYRRQK